MVLLRGPSTYTCICLQGGVYLPDNILLRPSQKTQKRDIPEGSMTINNILLKMAFGGHLGFGYLRLHLEWFLHTRKHLKRHIL